MGISKKKISKRISTPEDFLFGFLVALSVSFAVLCYAGSRNMPEVAQISVKSENQAKQENKLRKMVGGYPMEKMVPFLARRDKKVAAYLVAIAKKESNWGKYSPKKNGKDCYNYWGFRGKRNRTRSGYSCFGSPQEAVKVVGKRIAELVAARVDTPGEMVLWKCGRNCGGREAHSAKKWVSDVNYYYQKVI